MTRTAPPAAVPVVMVSAKLSPVSSRTSAWISTAAPFPVDADVVTIVSSRRVIVSAVSDTPTLSGVGAPKNPWFHNPLWLASSSPAAMRIDPCRVPPASSTAPRESATRPGAVREIAPPGASSTGSRAGPCCEKGPASPTMSMLLPATANDSAASRAPSKAMAPSPPRNPNASGAATSSSPRSSVAGSRTVPSGVRNSLALAM